MVRVLVIQQMEAISMTRVRTHTARSKYGRSYTRSEHERRVAGPYKVRATKQRRTWYLQNIATGKMKGRDADSKHPKGTRGKRDGTRTLQNRYGILGGRKGK